MTEAGKGVSATESLLYQKKSRTISQSSNGIFRSMYFSRTIENDPFVQNRVVLYSRINNTVYAIGEKHTLGSFGKKIIRQVQFEVIFQAAA